MTLEIHFLGMHRPEPCFLWSLASVLDLNAFERQNKAEGLGMVTEEGTRKSLTHVKAVLFLITIINSSWLEPLLGAS